MKRNLAAGLFLIIIISLYTTQIHQVAAPPCPHGYTCGLVSALDTDVHISYEIVDATIIPDMADGENLTHSIEVSSSYNITNTADHDVNFLTSYVRSSWAPHITYLSNPMNVTIEGNSSHYNASIMYNISTQAELPEGIGSRYSSRFFESFIDPQIDVMNLTMAAHTNLVLSVETAILVRCCGDFFDFRYGLDMQKLKTDCTHLDGRLDVANTSLLVRTEFLNSHSRSVNRVGRSLIATWSISDWDWDSESPYPGMQFEDDVFGDYIGVQLWQSEYFPPGYHLSLETQFLYLTLTLATSFTILVALSRRNKL
ncbi:MAG: hypothetical protein PVJ05_10340 [Candidatus Thorarchaeota archaeon]|jgi:hypothetical protein